MGYYETNDYINISEKAYSRASSPVISFRIEKTSEVTTVDTGYRYEGINPNNYILFNNELWRIIGIFETEYDSNNSGVANATGNLVKIIREDSLGTLVWNKTSNNDWPNSSLYRLLNELYYDWETNKSNVDTFCYQSYSSGAPIYGNCDYSIKGIQDGYRNMLLKTKWYLGGGGKNEYSSYRPISIYSYEREPNAVNTGRSSNMLGYIGLMYESDFLYGVLASDCSRATLHGIYGTSNCTGKDWLRCNGYEWMLSPKSNEDYAWYLDMNGHIKSINVTLGFNVHPTLYLSPNVYRVSGTGTITDPYIIGMAS